MKTAQRLIDSREYAEWRAYESLETWDNDGWRQSSSLLCLLSNMLGSKSTPAEFMPIERARKTGAQIMRALRMFTGGGSK